MELNLEYNVWYLKNAFGFCLQVFFSAMLSKNSSDSQRFLDLVFSASPIGWEEGFVSRDVVAQLLCRILLR